MDTVMPWRLIGSRHSCLSVVIIAIGHSMSSRARPSSSVLGWDFAKLTCLYLRQKLVVARMMPRNPGRYYE
jgi:hypothetical protein